MQKFEVKFGLYLSSMQFSCLHLGVRMYVYMNNFIQHKSGSNEYKNK